MAVQASFLTLSAEGVIYESVGADTQVNVPLFKGANFYINASETVSILAYNSASASSPPTLTTSNSFPIPANTVLTFSLPFQCDSLAILGGSTEGSVWIYPLAKN